MHSQWFLFFLWKCTPSHELSVSLTSITLCPEFYKCRLLCVSAKHHLEILQYSHFLFGQSSGKFHVVMRLLPRDNIFLW